MILCVLSLVFLAFIVPIFHRFLKSNTAFILSLAPLIIFSWFLIQYFNGVASTPLQESWQWNHYFNLHLAFYLDGLSLLFAMLISGIGFLIFIYAGFYMKDEPGYSRFLMILTLFMGAMLGLVLADNWLGLLVFWEMTSITSFLLIGHHHEKEKVRYAAWQGLLVTAFGGLALLAGMVLLGIATNEYSLSGLSDYQQLITQHHLYIPIIICVCLGAFTKSAQMPFHFWLPNAMAAPTPVSAYLHSATMVKAGIYFFARFSSSLGNTIEWQILLCTFGGITMLVGAIMALRSNNLKKLLAYSTISALGIMVVCFGIGTEKAIYAGIVFVVAHALYKSSLFMLAGIIDKQTGTKKISELPANLYKKLPLAFIFVLIAALSFAGIFPFLGFIAKEMLVEMALHSTVLSGVITVLISITGLLFVSIMLMLTHKAFFKKDANESGIQQVPYLFYLAPALTALLGLFFGVFPEVLTELISQASQSVMPDAAVKEIKLWHGFNTAFYVSLFSIIAGIILYWLKSKTSVKLNLSSMEKLTPSAIYDYCFNGLLRLAKLHTQFIQTGYLRYYAMFTLLATMLLLGFTFFYKAGFRLNTAEIEIYIFEVVLGIITIMGLAFIIFTKSKIDALLALSIIGIAISILFLEGGAPDLAITFILIDILTLIIFVLILHKLPKKIIAKNKVAKFRDAFIALGSGVLVTFILFSITYQPLNSALKDFYSQNSYTLAKGKNMVNVILVDFRVLDTLGEIIVLAIAALGVFALVNFDKQNKLL